MQLYYFSGIRFPSEKAHALYVAKCAESYTQLGHPTTVVVPRRLGRSHISPEKYFNLSSKIKRVILPTIDVFWIPGGKKIAHWLNVICFSIAAFFYASFFISKKTSVVIASDAVVAHALALAGCKTVWEIHDYPEKKRTLYRSVVQGSKLIMVNTHKKSIQLVHDFGISEEKIIALPNGVDFKEFAIDLTQEDARTRLGLSRTEPVVLYTGHLFPWKGADVLGMASARISGEVYFVGGTQSDIDAFASRYGSNPKVHVVGHRPHDEMPIWLRAADILVIPNSGISLISRDYASPMKLFEYMASGRPIIASKVEAIEEVLPSDAAYYIQPDDPEELANVANEILSNTEEATQRARIAQEVVRSYTWDVRAQKMVERYASL